MTFVTMRWVQEHALDVFKAPKTVLAYLAMKAHFDDGTAAWPSMETIATECGLSVRTVQRSIDQLVDMGWLELGEQDFSRIDPRTGRQVRADRRTVVWNVVCRQACPDLMRSETVEETRRDDGMGACMRHAREVADRRREDRAEPSGTPAAGPADAIDDGNVTPCDAKKSPRQPGPETPRGDISAGNPAKMSPNIQEIHTYPSAPTEHLPNWESHTGHEEGESRTGIGDPDAAGNAIRWEPATPEPDADPVDRFLHGLASRRGELGLTSRPVIGRDRAAIRRLIGRLRAQGVGDPLGLMDRVLDNALDGDWQAKRVDSGARFARLFDELRNDLTCDERHRARRRQSGIPAVEPRPSETAPPVKPHRHTWRCTHVLAALSRSAEDADRLGADALACAKAAELNRRDSPAEATPAVPGEMGGV